MNLNKLLSTKERRRLLETVIFSDSLPNASCLSKQLKISKGLVSQYFTILASEGIVKRSGNKISTRDNLRVKTLKILLTLDSLNINLSRYPFIRGAGIYGSTVKGENTANSDIDLWILTDDVKDEELSKVTAELKRKNQRISPLYLTSNKIKELKEKDKLFYHSLFFGSIYIFGERIETA